MLNITFNGDIYDSNNTPSFDVAYKLYFISSQNQSLNKWSQTRYTEDNISQYNFNLGDPDILGNDGSYSIGDEVLLIFWKASNLDHTSDQITEYCAIHYILDDRQTYIQDVQLLNHQAPLCSFSASASGNVNSEFYVFDTGSNDEYYWIFSNKDHFQICEFENEQIFIKNCLQNTSVSIDWGDGTVNNGIDIYDFPVSHKYLDSSDYDINLTFRNSDSLSCSWTKNVHITYTVHNSLVWNTPVYVGSENTYTPQISGSVDRIQKVDYYIDGVLEYHDLFYDESFNHTFDSPGEHVIRQCITYNDGFIDTEKCKDFIVRPSCVAHYYEQEWECSVRLISDSIPGVGAINNYKWELIHESEVLHILEGPDKNIFYCSFPYTGVFRVKLTVSDQYSSCSYEKEYTIQECIGTSSSGSGSGGGGSSPWIYNEYKEIKPKFKIINIECNDKKRRLLILDIREVNNDEQL